MSLAQMEAALKPDAIERFARIDLFKKFEKLQAERVETRAARRRRSRKTSTRSSARN